LSLVAAKLVILTPFEASAAEDPIDITDRMRTALRGKRVKVKAMFGGVCFMLRDHMLCAASPRGYLFRAGKEGSAAAQAARPIPGSASLALYGEPITIAYAPTQLYRGSGSIEPERGPARATKH
jgi:hypothetical protein